MKKIITLYYLIILLCPSFNPLRCSQSFISYDSNLDETDVLKKNHTLKYDLRADLRFHRFTHGDIIYVYGTSTAGKTTFTRKLAEFLPEYTLVSTRDLKTKYWAKLINEACPVEYTYVSKHISTDTILIYLRYDTLSIPEHSMLGNNYKKIVNSLRQIKDKYNLLKKRYNPIEELSYVYDHVFMLSGKNRNVIVDNVDALNFLTYISLYNIHSPLHLLLTYCPASILLDRVIKRNKVAMKRDLRNQRSPMRPLETFVNIYTSTKNESFIDEIQQDSLIETFITAYFISREGNDNHPMSKLPWQEIIDVLNSNFGTSSSIKLQSKYPYCMLLDTSKETAKELAVKVQHKVHPIHD